MGFQKCYIDHFVFTRRTSSGTVILVVYVDDILLTRSDVDHIEKAKEYLKTRFVTKHMGMLKYFSRIEIVDSQVHME